MADAAQIVASRSGSSEDLSVTSSGPRPRRASSAATRDDVRAATREGVILPQARQLVELERSVGITRKTAVEDEHMEVDV